MKSVPLTAYARTAIGRNAVRQLRGVGRIPTVIYGRNRTAQNLELNQRELDKLIAHSASENILVDLAIEGDSRPQRLALVQDVQHDPMSGKILHIDFHEVSADEKVTLMVPIEAVGQPAGVKDGGILEYVLHKIRVRALPADLPAVLQVDVTSLGLDSSLHLGEIVAPAGVEILGDKKVPVLAVAAPRAEAEETAAADAAAGPAEVEMIKEKKDEEGAADGKKADAGKKPEKAEKK